MNNDFESNTSFLSMAYQEGLIPLPPQSVKPEAATSPTESVNIYADENGFYRPAKKKRTVIRADEAVLDAKSKGPAFKERDKSVPKTLANEFYRDKNVVVKKVAKTAEEQQRFDELRQIAKDNLTRTKSVATGLTRNLTLIS